MSWAKRNSLLVSTYYIVHASCRFAVKPIDVPYALRMKWSTGAPTDIHQIHTSSVHLFWGQLQFEMERAEECCYHSNAHRRHVLRRRSKFFSSFHLSNFLSAKNIYYVDAGVEKVVGFSSFFQKSSHSLFTLLISLKIHENLFIVLGFSIDKIGQHPHS